MDTYPFDKFQVKITGHDGGSFLLGTDRAANITISRSGTPSKTTVGAGRTVMHSLNANKSGRATIHLLRNSQVNKMLSQLFSYQRARSAAWGRNTIEICDMGGNVISTCNGVAFVNSPMNGKCEFDVAIIDP